MLRSPTTTHLPAAVFLAASLLVLSLGCRPAPATQEPNSLVWEAWYQIKESYVQWDGLDSQAVVGSIMASLLDLTGAPPYPFLTEVARVRGQPPVGVPAELADVWRALVLHQKEWPEIPESVRAEAAIIGMVEGLKDPSAAFLSTGEEYAKARESLAGSYQGIGASVAVEAGRIVLFPTDDSQAKKAGLQPRDALLAVAGEAVAGLSVDEVANRVRGPAGTGIKLLVERAGEAKPLEYQVIRSNIELPSVDYQLMPGGIGYLAISRFRENTGDTTLDALKVLKRLDMLALVLDLRSNPGGSPDAARQVVSQFLPPGGVFIYQVDRMGKRRDSAILDNGLMVKALPMVVLVDENTAGVAEAVAGALQEAHRATILGTRTFGKGSINAFVEFSNGGALYLPTTRWYTPSGRPREGVGVQPDIPVPFQFENRGLGESQINQAYDYLNNQLPPFR
ncbi:MAG: S41 family peptidase [Chloroflexota bacterium]